MQSVERRMTRAGRHPFPSRALHSVLRATSRASLGLLLSVAVAAAAPLAVIVRPEAGSAQVEAGMRTALERAGYTVSARSFDEILAGNGLDGANLVALPDARALPVDLHEPIESHLLKGGHLLAFGLPAWKTPLIRVDGRWVTTDAYQAAAAWNPPPHRVLDFAAEDLSRWTRSSNALTSPARYTVETVLGKGPALTARVFDLTSWDTFVSPSLDQPFPEAHTRTVFAARGGAATHALAVEWEERDGSRWIATVPLTTEWRRYELPPEAFKYWTSTPSRGGPGDRFRPRFAARFSVGLAFTHTGSAGGAHEWQFANLGTARAQDAPLSVLSSAMSLDGLFPGDNSFPVRGASALKVVSPIAFSDIRLPKGAELRSPHPRPSGAGFDKRRKVRFVPLLEARAPGGAWRGVPGAAYVHVDDKFGGGVWALFGITDPAVLSHPSFVRGVERVARWMRGPILAEGGTHWYTLFPGQRTVIGARTVRPTEDARVSVVIARKRDGRTAWSKTWPASDEVVSAQWAPPAGDPGPWTVTTTLRRGPMVTDRITQDLHVYRPPAQPHFITAAGGRLLLNGVPWKVHGVNYMPSSGIARDLPDDSDDFEYWIGRAPYDSAIVARDLDRVRGMGLNAVSIFIYGASVDSGNLLDILRLCHERGLRVDVSLRPGTPMDFQWSEIKPIIQRYRLAESDVVFAYDLAWEPFWGGREARAQYDPLWTKWVVRRYGSLDAAEAAWAFKPPRAGDTLSGATDEQVTDDGPWTKMALDYRAFLNGYLNDRYNAARRLVRSVDRRHLVSFRMTETSNPTYHWPASLNYDFAGLVNAVDIWAPEGYGRTGGWENAKPGWFQVQYARALDPQKPLVWKEYGLSAWQAGLDEAPPERLKAQADSYEAFYRMLTRSGSNGVFFWWFPGGHRTGEDSDYGILNPDGTDRPVTKVIRASAAAFLKAPAPVKTDAEVPIRLDHASGLYGTYQDAKDRFWGLVGQGKSPRLVIGR